MGRNTMVIVTVVTARGSEKDTRERSERAKGNQGWQPSSSSSTVNANLMLRTFLFPCYLSFWPHCNVLFPSCRYNKSRAKTSPIAFIHLLRKPIKNGIITIDIWILYVSKAPESCFISLYYLICHFV